MSPGAPPGARGSFVRAEGRAPGFVVLVHGGAGDVPEADRPEHAAGCEAAARAGAEVLAGGGSALDAAVAAVASLEENPRFNAGLGACLDEDEHVRLDAAVACGPTRRFAGVAALPPFASPIAIARRLLDEDGPVLLVAEGAARYAAARGFARLDEAALVTARARARWAGTVAPSPWAGGTVGAVVRDAEGRTAAATSTGGTIRKAAGRVGDSPVPGAGTWATAAGAVSTTGHGEAFLRAGTARTTLDAAASAASLARGADLALTEVLSLSATGGGLVAVGADGAWVAARTTATMSWAVATPDGVRSGV